MPLFCNYGFNQESYRKQHPRLQTCIANTQLVKRIRLKDRHDRGQHKTKDKSKLWLRLLSDKPSSLSTREYDRQVYNVLSINTSRQYECNVKFIIFFCLLVCLGLDATFNSISVV